MPSAIGYSGGRHLLRGTPDERRNWMPDFYNDRATGRMLRAETMYAEDLQREAREREVQKTYLLRVKADKARRMARKYNAPVPTDSEEVG